MLRKYPQTSACAWLPQSSSSSQCFVFSNQQKLLDTGIPLYSLSISIFNGTHTHVGLGASLEEVFQPTVLLCPHKTEHRSSHQVILLEGIDESFRVDPLQ